MSDHEAVLEGVLVVVFMLVIFGIVTWAFGWLIGVMSAAIWIMGFMAWEISGVLLSKRKKGD